MGMGHIEELAEVSTRLARVEDLCERSSRVPVWVPISTFAPEPFEVVRDFCVVVQAEDYVATLFDANVSSSGDTQEEAVANLKDLILMIFRGCEGEADDALGPAMVRQKHALLSLIRRS